MYRTLPGLELATYIRTIFCDSISFSQFHSFFPCLSHEATTEPQAVLLCLEGTSVNGDLVLNTWENPKWGNPAFLYYYFYQTFITHTSSS